MEQIRLSPSSTDEILARSSGEITRAAIFDPRSDRHAARGPCCETIFGRENDWECKCGRLRGTRDIGYICIRCEEPVTHLRSTRWGHIALASPVVNPLFLPTLATLLDYTPTALRQVVRMFAFVVLEPGCSGYSAGDLIHSDDYHAWTWADHGPGCEVGTGAEAVRRLLARLDLLDLHEKLAHDSAQRHRFRLIDRICRVAPEDPNGYAARMLLDCIPVLPPALRLPRRQGGDGYGESLTTTYAGIIERNNRLRKLQELSAPEVIILNEKRMLQARVEILFENAPQRRRRGWAWYDANATSLADRLRGPTRERLLTRRVDYSASGILVPDSDLASDAVALPIGLAVELFRTHLLIRLGATPLIDLLHPRARGGMDESHVASLRLYRELLESQGDGLVPLVEEVMREHRLVLSVHTDQPGPLVALRPVLGKHNVVAIHGETLVRLDAKPGMRAYLHLPLSAPAREEAKSLIDVERLPPKQTVGMRKEMDHRSDATSWFGGAQAERRATWTDRKSAERQRVEVRRAKYGEGLFAELLLNDPLPSLAKYAATGRAELVDDFLGRWMRGAIVSPLE